MDQWKTKLELPPQQNQHLPNPYTHHRERTQVEMKDPNAARKVQKADREKLRRDRLNEQFVELGNVLDPERPKNDKASILIDTIQVLRDLTTEVNRLKAECTALSEESCELTLEKNELREEKSCLKSDIENLNTQYQQRVGVMFPWGAIDPSSVVMPPPYSFPVAMPVASGPVPMHPFPFFGNHNPPGPIPTSSTAFIPYPSPANAHINQPMHAPTSSSSSKHECGSKSPDGLRGSDVVTELELKTPGSRPGQDKKRKQLERIDGFEESPSNSLLENNGRSNE